MGVRGGCRQPLLVSHPQGLPLPARAEAKEQSPLQKSNRRSAPCRWRDEATKAGCTIHADRGGLRGGPDGFWLARWLRTRGIEAYVIQASSVSVSREHRRARTDRLDVELLKRAFLGWLRGERDHCKMAAIATLEAADARRPSRDREALVGERTASPPK